MARDADDTRDAVQHLRDGEKRVLELASAGETQAPASLAQDAHDEPLFGAQWHLESPGGFVWRQA